MSLQQIHSPKMSFVQNDMLSNLLQHATILRFKISRWSFSEPQMSFKCLIYTERDIQLSFMPLNIFFLLLLVLINGLVKSTVYFKRGPRNLVELPTQTGTSLLA